MILFRGCPEACTIDVEKDKAHRAEFKNPFCNAFHFSALRLKRANLFYVCLFYVFLGHVSFRVRVFFILYTGWVGKAIDFAVSTEAFRCWLCGCLQVDPLGCGWSLVLLGFLRMRRSIQKFLRFFGWFCDCAFILVSQGLSWLAAIQARSMWVRQ